MLAAMLRRSVALNSGNGLSGGSCGCTHTGGGQHVRLHHAALDVQLADVHAQLGSQLGSHGAGLGTGHKVLHVLGHHGPVGAGAGDLGEVIALFLRQLLGVGSRQHVGTGGTVRMGRGGGVALRQQDLQQGAVLFALHVVGQLIRRYGEQDVPLLDSVALFIFPLFNGALGHRQAELGHQYFSCHT